MLKYPLSTTLDRFMPCRDGRGIGGLFKRLAERRALNQCLAGLGPVESVCDAPCGPGRLFDYWASRSMDITGVELSVPMAEAAGQNLCDRQFKGRVIQGDVFDLSRLLPEPVDLVACVRFIYYFESEDRVRLLRSLARCSKRYVLVQYKTLQSWRGVRTHRNRRRADKHFCTETQMREELNQAGFQCLRIIPISRFSDRVFVVGEKG